MINYGIYWLQIPLDGVIVYGEALVSSEHITGEALPVRKGKGEEVPAGSINHDGLLVVQVSRTLDQSTPARIVSLTRQAQARTSLYVLSVKPGWQCHSPFQQSSC